MSDVRGGGGLAAATEVVRRSPLGDDFKITATTSVVDLIKKIVKTYHLLF